MVAAYNVIGDLRQELSSQRDNSAKGLIKRAEGEAEAERGAQRCSFHTNLGLIFCFFLASWFWVFYGICCVFVLFFLGFLSISDKPSYGPGAISFLQSELLDSRRSCI